MLQAVGPAFAQHLLDIPGHRLGFGSCGHQAAAHHRGGDHAVGSGLVEQLEVFLFHSGGDQIHIGFDVVDGQADQDGGIVTPRRDQDRFGLVDRGPAQGRFLGCVTEEGGEPICHRTVDRFPCAVDDHDIALGFSLGEQCAGGGAAGSAESADDGVLVESLVQLVHIALLGSAIEKDRDFVGGSEEENQEMPGAPE